MTDKNQTILLYINIYLALFNVIIFVGQLFESAGNYFAIGIVAVSFLVASKARDIADSAKVLTRFNVPIFLLLLALMAGQVVRLPASEHGIFMSVTLIVMILVAVSLMVFIALNKKIFVSHRSVNRLK